MIFHLHTNWWVFRSIMLSLLLLFVVTILPPTWRTIKPLPLHYSIISNIYQTSNNKILLTPCGCTRTLEMVNWPQEFYNGSREDSTCSSWATLRGPGQKVVSYNVYGQFPSEYYKGVEVLVGTVKEMYPGWTMRLYLDITSPDVRTWACALACTHSHLDVCDVHNIPGLGNVSSSFGTTWRFLVMGDPLVDRYISRDTDTPIIQREVDAVNEWITGKKCFHMMRDHPWHGVSMLAGMWGGCNSWNTTRIIEARTAILKDAKTKLDDQKGLWKYLWPLVSNNATMHDSHSCSRFSGSLPFPTRRINNTFVGMRTYRAKYTYDGISTKCPVKCRPKLHKDWEKC